MSGIRSVLGRVVTWLKRSALFSWLHHAGVTLKQSIMGNRSLPEALIQTGLWLLLLWLLSNLHMGLPCFLLALIFWLYNTYGGGPPLSTAFSWRQQEQGRWKTLILSIFFSKIKPWYNIIPSKHTLFDFLFQRFLKILLMIKNFAWYLSFRIQILVY